MRMVAGDGSSGDDGDEMDASDLLQQPAAEKKPHDAMTRQASEMRMVPTERAMFEPTTRALCARRTARRALERRQRACGVRERRAVSAMEKKQRRPFQTTVSTTTVSNKFGDQSI